MILKESDNLVLLGHCLIGLWPMIEGLIEKAILIKSKAAMKIRVLSLTQKPVITVTLL